ncbi:PrgI family protein [Sinanaerobacter sp. ZZT-01]|uniref:PrgI family protein n=1 Tax=Sinanaerobacter sp. ZZT-01 TaxID=3111540 RepID=UPI002D79734C|nr:PrgI family protein [Sinanaerobacter sp. ZZT-01]WRR94240.1 PrgI family protein [Sinanaerobacter sp. ZZT-01]
MIEIKIPKEIRKYKETFWMGMTLRQTICAVAACAMNIPLYLWLSDYIGRDLAGWIVMFTTTPLALIGFFTYNGMKFEKLAWCVFRFNFLPQKRKYQTENLFAYLIQETEDEDDEMERK